jgi:hypothetical protein
VPTIHSRMQDWRARKVLASGAHSRDPVALHTPAVQPRDGARPAPALTSAGKTSSIGGLAQRVRAKRGPMTGSGVIRHSCCMKMVGYGLRLPRTKDASHFLNIVSNNSFARSSPSGVKTTDFTLPTGS